MARPQRLICASCDAKIPEQSFCPRCGTPTPVATHDERILWEMGQWESKRPSAGERKEPKRASIPLSTTPEEPRRDEPAAPADPTPPPSRPAPQPPTSEPQARPASRPQSVPRPQGRVPVRPATPEQAAAVARTRNDEQRPDPSTSGTSQDDRQKRFSPVPIPRTAPTPPQEPGARPPTPEAPQRRPVIAPTQGAAALQPQRGSAPPARDPRPVEPEERPTVAGATHEQTTIPAEPGSVPHPDPRAFLHRLGRHRGGDTPTGAPYPAPAETGPRDEREEARLEREAAKQRAELERRRAAEEKEQGRLAREREAAEAREAEARRSAEQEAARERAREEEQAARERAKREEQARKEAARVAAAARKQAELKAKADAEAQAAAQRRAQAEEAERAKLAAAERAVHEKRQREEAARAAKERNAEAKAKARADAKAAKLAAQIAKAAAKKEAKQEARLAKEAAAHNAKVSAERAKAEAKAAKAARRQSTVPDGDDASETAAPAEAYAAADDVHRPRSARAEARHERRIAKLAARLGLVEGETITVAVDGTVRLSRAMLLVTNFRVAVVKRSPRRRVRWIPLEEVANIRHKRGWSHVMVSAPIERMRFAMRRPSVLTRAVETLRAEVRDARTSSASARHDAEIMQIWVDRTSELWESGTGRARLWLRQNPGVVVVLALAAVAAIAYAVVSVYVL